MAVRSAMLLAGRAPAEYPVPLPFARGNTKGRSPRVRSRRGGSASKQLDRDVPLSSQSSVQLYIHGCGMGSRQGPAECPQTRCSLRRRGGGSEDERALTMREPFSDDEERWITLGLDAFGQVLVLVYAWRGDRMRLISARKATGRERRRYEEADEA